MKKKLIPIFLISIFILGFFNYKFFLGNFYNSLGNFYYIRDKFFLSLIYHKKAYKYSKTNKIIYNIGNDYYKIGDYENSLEEYKKIINNNFLEVKKLYNLGNIFYKLGEEYEKERIYLWQQALSSYKSVLSLEEDIYSKKNYDFVLEKLNNLKKKEEEKQNTKEEEKQEENIKEKNKKEEEENTKKGKPLEERLSKYKLNSNSEISNLTSNEKKELETYLKFLKAVEKSNQEVFNKKNSEPNSNLELFKDELLGDIFFDKVFNNGEEKDW